MFKHIWEKDKFLFLYILCSLFIIVFSIRLGHDYALFGDDLVYSTYFGNEKMLNCLNFNFGHGGGYIGYFLSKFFSFGLPNMLKIHPCDFVNIHLGLKGIFTVITLFLLTKFSIFYCKSKSVYAAFFCLLSFYYFYSLCKLNTLITGVSYNYYRYSFSFIFFSIFLYYICKNLLSPVKLKNNKALICAVICGFIIGTSSEILFISLILFAVLILFYQAVIHIIYKVNKNESFIKSYKLNISKNIFYPFASLVIAVNAFTSSQGFHNVAGRRGICDITINFDVLKEFIIQFFNLYVINEIVFIIVCAVVLILSYKIAAQRKEAKKIIIPVLFAVAVLGTFFSLILCGKTFYIKDEFWLVHPRIKFLYLIMILYPALMIISYFVKTLKIKAKIVPFIVIVGFIYLILLIHTNIYGEINSFSKRIKDMKIHSYKLEKIFRFYRLKGEIPYLPGYIDNRDIFRFKLPEKEDCFFQTDNNFLMAYYSNIYNDKKVYYIPYCVSDTAYEKFINAGGNFSEEELRDIKFSRLFDEKFVLNEK